MIILAEPAPEDMVQAIQQAIYMLPNIDPQIMHSRVSMSLLLFNRLLILLTDRHI
jgi:hypothetical protein